MREKDFSLYNATFRVKVDGGHLWKAPPRKVSGGIMTLNEGEKKLGIYLHPEDDFATLQNALFKIVRTKSLLYYVVLQIRKRLPSLLLLFPIALTMTIIAFITVWGDLVVNWFFLEENADTIVGIPMNESIIVYSVLAIVLIYFFPVLFTTEHSGFIETLNERFANRKALRKRFGTLLRFLQRKGYVQLVEIWNPDLSNAQHDWVGHSFIPSVLDNDFQLNLQVRIDERKFVENYFQKMAAQDLDWEERDIEQDEHFAEPIAYEYLEPWEKSLLAVYVFASTASLTKRWHRFRGDGSSGELHNAVSLRLVKILMEQFAERLFSEEDLGKLISLDLFSSRCVNDYAILKPTLRFTNDVCAINEKAIFFERVELEEEMKFMASYLQRNIVEVMKLLDDPVAAIKLNSIQENESIYNKNRLAAIRFFVDSISISEQYTTLKKYWTVLIENPSKKQDANNNIYRILGVDSLLKLATIFERAAMYEHAYDALDYIEQVYPFKGKMGKARIKERQGKYKDAVRSMLTIQDDWREQKITLAARSIIDLNLDISWAIVSGRLVKYQAIGRASLAEAKSLLHSNFDAIRNSDQTIRVYNILANYEEWEGRPAKAIAHYNMALKIPGVHQAGLSNLLVNKGIALRQIKELPQAIISCEQGVEIKMAIGDADQLPIALHNLAQTYIELAFGTLEEKPRIRYFEKALIQALKGLEIQDQTGSVKKRGQLLTEKFICEYQLSSIQMGEPSKEAFQSLEMVQDWLENESQLGKLNTYDCRVVWKELFNLMEEVSFNSLDDIVNWSLLPGKRAKSS